MVSAGSRTLSAQDFKLRFDNYRKEIEQRNGEPLTPDQAVERGVDRQILQELALQESIALATSGAADRANSAIGLPVAGELRPHHSPDNAETLSPSMMFRTLGTLCSPRREATVNP